jgi:hypothetical protein
MDNKPKYTAYSVKPSAKQDGKDTWIKIGAAWPHKEGSGLNIELDLIPYNPRIVLMEYKEKEQNNASETAQS